MKLTETRLRSIIREERQRMEESAPGSQMKMKLDKLKRLQNSLKSSVNPNDLPPKAESKFIKAQATLNKAVEELEIAVNTFKNQRRKDSNYV